MSVPKMSTTIKISCFLICLYVSQHILFFFLSVINIYGKHVEFNFLPNVNKEIWMLSISNIWKPQNNNVQIVFGIIFHELFNEPQTYGRDMAVDQSQMCNAKEPK